MNLHFTVKLNGSTLKRIEELADAKGQDIKDFLTDKFNEKLASLASSKKRKHHNPVPSPLQKRAAQVMRDYHLGRCKSGTAADLIKELEDHYAGKSRPASMIISELQSEIG